MKLSKADRQLLKILVHQTSGDGVLPKLTALL
jgi:hypothetical protein